MFYQSDLNSKTHWITQTYLSYNRCKRSFLKTYFNKIYLNNIFCLISKEIQLCNYLNFEDVSVLLLSLRRDRQGLESSLLQYPATFNFSNGIFADKTKRDHLDLHWKSLRYSTLLLWSEANECVIKCLQFTIFSVLWMVLVSVNGVIYQRHCKTHGYTDKKEQV